MNMVLSKILELLPILYYIVLYYIVRNYEVKIKMAAPPTPPLKG